MMRKSKKASWSSSGLQLVRGEMCRFLSRNSVILLIQIFSQRLFAILQSITDSDPRVQFRFRRIRRETYESKDFKHTSFIHHILTYTLPSVIQKLYEIQPNLAKMDQSYSFSIPRFIETQFKNKKLRTLRTVLG